MKKKLTNTIEDKTLLKNLLSSGSPVKAKFSLGYFATEFADSLETKEHDGVVTGIDMESGYCNWENARGIDMFVVSINTITLI